jgi:hypothetical protein
MLMPLSGIPTYQSVTLLVCFGQSFKVTPYLPELVQMLDFCEQIISKTPSLVTGMEISSILPL